MKQLFKSFTQIIPLKLYSIYGLGYDMNIMYERDEQIVKNKQSYQFKIAMRGNQKIKKETKNIQHMKQCIAGINHGQLQGDGHNSWLAFIIISCISSLGS